MQKKRCKGGLSILIVLMLFSSLTLVSAQEADFNPGITPDSPFYFIDKFLDRFGDELGVKEEKIAEIKAMIEAGKYEEAREALREYKELAKELEKEISPEEKEDAEKSAEAIKDFLEGLDIPDEFEEEFVGDVLDQEDAIVTAAQIAGKIKELCEQLSELDPNEYYRVCRAEEEDPKWHKNLDEELTAEQEEEAKRFGQVMKQCFETSGEVCKCEEIPNPEFAEACSVAAPLAVACDEGKEAACEELDDLEMPELAPHLQKIFDKLEKDVGGAKFDLHMPPECVEAGALSREECAVVMIQTHAPEECKEALLAAEDITSEREGREICDRIMMEIHAPECVEEGITDPEECKNYMFDIGERPQECQENGIHDLRDCQRFLEEGGKGGEGFGPRINFDCREISDPTKRLECYDQATTQVDFRHEEYDEMDGCLPKEEFERLTWGCEGRWEPIYKHFDNGRKCPEAIECIEGDPYSSHCPPKEELDINIKRCEGEGGRWDMVREGECSFVKCYVDEHKNYCPSDEEQKKWISECEAKNGKWEFKQEGECSFVKCQWEEAPPFDCALLDCQQGYYCDPYMGCRYGGDHEGEGGGEDTTFSECKDGCSQECGDQNTDCVDNKCVCLGYGENGPPQEQPIVDEQPPAEEPPVEEPPVEEEPPTDESGGVGITGNAFLEYWFD